MHIRVKVVGKGIEIDPIRPDLDSIPEIAQLHKAIEEAQRQGIDLTNITFYTVQVISYDEKTQEFEVEIKVNKNIVDKLPEPVKTAFKKLCSSAEKSGT